jgi:hypothetical protein
VRQEDLPNYNSGYFWEAIEYGVPIAVALILIVWLITCFCDYDKPTDFEKRRRTARVGLQKDEKKNDKELKKEQ